MKRYFDSLFINPRNVKASDLLPKAVPVPSSIGCYNAGFIKYWVLDSDGECVKTSKQFEVPDLIAIDEHGVRWIKFPRKLVQVLRDDRYYLVTAQQSMNARKRKRGWYFTLLRLSIKECYGNNVAFVDDVLWGEWQEGTIYSPNISPFIKDVSLDIFE